MRVSRFWHNAVTYHNADSCQYHSQSVHLIYYLLKFKSVKQLTTKPLPCAPEVIEHVMILMVAHNWQQPGSSYQISKMDDTLKHQEM